MLIVEIEHCSNNDRFLWFNTIFFYCKKTAAKQHDMFDFDKSVFLLEFDPCIEAF